MCNDYPLPNGKYCLKGGYQDPNGCHKCKCPDGFGGDYCELVAPSIGGMYKLISEIIGHMFYILIYKTTNVNIVSMSNWNEMSIFHALLLKLLYYVYSYRHNNFLVYIELTTHNPIEKPFADFFFYLA